MISFRIISQQVFEKLSQSEAHAVQEFQTLVQKNSQLAQQVRYYKEQNEKSIVQHDIIANENSNLKTMTKSLEVDLSKAQHQIINMRTVIQIIEETKINAQALLQNVIEQKKSAQSINNDFNSKILTLEKGLLIQNKKIEEHQDQLRKRQEVLSQLVQTLRIERDRNHDKQNRLNDQKQQNSVLNQKYIKVQQIENDLKIHNQAQRTYIEELKKKINQLQESPIGKLNEQLKSKQKWIKQLTTQLSALKQRYVSIQMQGGGFRNKFYSQGSMGSKNVQIVSSHKHVQIAKYIAVCKNILQQFNSKMKKLNSQKKKTQQRYKQIKSKLHEYQYNQFMYKDKLNIYIEKIDRYQKLTQKQQSQMQKIIFQFDAQLNNIIKMKESQKSCSKFKQEIKQKSIYSLQDSAISNSLTYDRFEVQLLRKQVQDMKKDIKKYRKKYITKNQTFEKLQVENHCLANELRSLKLFNFQIVKQLEIKVSEVQILRNFINSYNTPPNMISSSHEQFLENLSRISKKESLLNRVSSSQKFQYQVSEIDSELQNKNNTLLQKIKLNKLTLGYMDYAAGNPTKSNQRGFMKKNSKKESAESSQSSLFGSSIISDRSMNDSSFSSKNSCKSYGIKALYQRKENQSLNNQLEKYLFHKNSLN